MDCVFCKIIKGELPSLTIFEDDVVKVFLDIEPATNGDLLVVPKKHFESIIDIDLDTLNHINIVVKNLYPMLKEKLGFEGLTLVQNNGYGQDIKHYHLHLTPRYSNDCLRHDFNKDLLINIEEVYNQLTDK